VNNKKASNSLNKLALSNALVQSENEEIVNIPTKMFSSLFNEAIETNTMPTNLLIILLREGKELSSCTIIVDDVPQKMKN